MARFPSIDKQDISTLSTISTGEKFDFVLLLLHDRKRPFFYANFQRDCFVYDPPSAFFYVLIEGFIFEKSFSKYSQAK